MAKRVEVIFLRGGVDPFDAFDVFGDQTDVPELSTRDACAQVLTSLKVGDEFRIGRQKWAVWRTHGVTVLLTKAGTQGKKLYQLLLTGFEPCLFAVHEINTGSGEMRPGAPIAEGPME